MRVPEVPVKVMVGVAEAAVASAVRVVVAEGCAGVSVSVDGLAVTPEDRPEIETEIEPLKEFIAVAVTVIALDDAPALREVEVGETAREKSGLGLGGELPHVVSRKSVARAATPTSVLVRVGMARTCFRTIDCTAMTTPRCHRGVIV